MVTSASTYLIFYSYSVIDSKYKLMSKVANNYIDSMISFVIEYQHKLGYLLKYGVT